MDSGKLWRVLLPVSLLGSLELAAQTNPAPLVVHEWGTFTSLQDESGQAIGGINTDDEPVPPFVHRLANFLLLGPTELPAFFFQGAPRCHPDVTMRLETPVLYFHQSAGQDATNGVSVTATFRGGWLSEFYPNATVTAPGVQSNGMSFGPLRASTVSTLAWHNLELGGDWPGPTTTQHVWASPRAVQALCVRTAQGEAEKFLFYRGVAHIDAPIAVARHEKNDQLILRSQCSAEIAGHQPLNVNRLWLVDIGTEGQTAFRALPPVLVDSVGKTLLKTPSRFPPAEYSQANRARLKASVHAALVTAGLFDDEAEALLNTWELSYFKSPGQRLFFLVPRPWTDFYLPLEISVPAKTTRVLVGRIELVTSRQRDYLHQIAQTATNVITADASRLHAAFYNRIGTNPNELDRLTDGAESLTTGGVAVPSSYQWYLALGRFRNALILDESRNHRSAGLDQFISTYRLEGYNPVERSGI